MGSLLSEHENSPQAPRSTMIVLSRGAIICAIVTSVCSGTCGIDTMVMTSSFGHTLACSDCATPLRTDHDTLKEEALHVSLFALLDG